VRSKVLIAVPGLGLIGSFDSQPNSEVGVILVAWVVFFVSRAIMSTPRRDDAIEAPVGLTTRMHQLANIAFGREVMRKVVDVILPLNDGGVGLPFYCVHSITGSATDFRFMAEMLGPSQTFYGIQVPTAKRNADFATSIEAISRYYVDRLTAFQPTGTLLLGGHSVGAVIALEMAQQLRALGRDVGLLVVFDGELFNTGAEISAYHPLYWTKLIANVPAWVRDFLMEEFTFSSFCKTLHFKAVALAKSALASVRGTRTGHAVEGFIDLSRCTPDHAAFMKTLFENQYNYCPKEYSGRILLCIAKTHALTHLQQVEGPWRKIAPHADVVKFDATHTSLIRSPNGSAVAKCLASAIAEIDASARLRQIA
jgi:thioesterase domain-containing protein